MVGNASKSHLPTPALFLLVLLLAAACSTAPKRPVFYYGSYAVPVSKAHSDRDINQCMTLARQAGVSETKDGEVGKKAASGALLGGIGAGTWGLIRGDGGERMAAGAVAGGATGATKGAIDSYEQNPIFRKYVERCLADRGYQVIGWQ